MNDDIKLQTLWDAETAYWDNYWHKPNTEDTDIPDWYEDEKYEKFREEWGL